MVSEPKVIIITGSKGGGGKTPMSISVAVSYAEAGKNTLLCDFNFNNADTFTIIASSEVSNRKSNGWLEAVEKDGEMFWQINQNFWLNRWRNVLSLGLPSIESFWQKIYKISQMEYNAFRPEVIVVDTNLNLPLICVPETKVKDFDFLPPIEVWHLWSPSIVLQIGEQERFKRAITNLKKFNHGFEERMVHIFTPRHYSATNLMGTFSSLTRGTFRVTKQKKYKQRNPKPLLFDELQDVLFIDFLPVVLNYNPEEKPDLNMFVKTWLEKIIETASNRETKPNNLIVVPSVVNSVALLVEDLTLKPQKTLETLKNDLGSIYVAVNSFILENRV